MVETKKWGVDKTLALIGSIIYSICPLLLFIVGVAVKSVTPQELLSRMDTQTYVKLLEIFPNPSELFSLISGIIIFIAFITLIIMAFNWVAFAKIGGPKRRGWKIYYLIVGIITTFVGLISLASGIGFLFFIPGVLFILAFALNRSPSREAIVVQSGGMPIYASTPQVQQGSSVNFVNQSVSESSQPVTNTTSESLQHFQPIGEAFQEVTSVSETPTPVYLYQDKPEPIQSDSLVNGDGGSDSTKPETQWVVSKSGAVSKEVVETATENPTVIETGSAVTSGVNSEIDNKDLN